MTKPKIVHCLSEVKRNSVLQGTESKISKDCEGQVTFELLGEFEDIKLNPELNRACEDEVKKFCNHVKDGMSLYAAHCINSIL